MRGTGGHRDMPLLPYFLVTGSMSLGYGSIYTLLADLRDEFGFSETQLGVIAGAGLFAGFFVQAFLSRYADRGHSALMVRGGVAVAAVAMTASAVASSYWAFVLARVLLGLGIGLVGPAIRRIVIAQDPVGFGANLGRQASFDVAGFVLGPLVAAIAAQAFGIRAPFILLGALFVGLLLLTLRLDLSGGRVEEPEQRVVRALLQLPPMQAALAASIAFYLTIGTFEAAWAVLLRDRGAETWLIGLTLSLFTVPMIVLAPLGGRQAQQRGPLRVVSMSIGVAIVCTFSYGVLPSLWLLLAASLVHAMADAFTMPGNQVAVAVAAPPSQVAAALGLLGAVGLLAAGAVGVVAGVLYEHAGRFTLFSGVAAVMTLFLGVALNRGGPLLRPAVAPDVALTAVPSAEDQVDGPIGSV